MADRIHPSMHAMQPAPARAPSHRLPAEPKSKQLGEGDDTMLPRGELRQPGIERGSLHFVNSWLTNCRDPSHAPEASRRGRTCG
jgi:hypothetical protein